MSLARQISPWKASGLASKGRVVKSGMAVIG